MKAARSEIEGKWLFSIKELITAEVFEMAEHQLDTGYKAPPAAMCRNVLEEHIRQLCLQNEIEQVIVRDRKEIPKKTDALNAELARANVYSKLYQKMITGGLDLRNKAVHGHYDGRPSLWCARTSKQTIQPTLVPSVADDWRYVSEKLNKKLRIF